MCAVAWEGAASPVPRSEIERAERYWGISFPEDFVRCVVAHDGGTPSPGWIEIASGRYELLDHLLSFRREERNNIVQVAANLFEFLPVGVLPFGEDGNGNYFVFDFRNDGAEPSLGFVFHENFRDPESTKIETVSESFTEFLERLVPDPFLDE